MAVSHCEQAIVSTSCCPHCTADVIVWPIRAQVRAARRQVVAQKAAKVPRGGSSAKGHSAAPAVPADHAGPADRAVRRGPAAPPAGPASLPPLALHSWGAQAGAGLKLPAALTGAAHGAHWGQEEEGMEISNDSTTSRHQLGDPSPEPDEPHGTHGTAHCHAAVQSPVQPQQQQKPHPAAAKAQPCRAATARAARGASSGGKQGGAGGEAGAAARPQRPSAGVCRYTDVWQNLKKTCEGFKYRIWCFCVSACTLGFQYAGDNKS